MKKKLLVLFQYVFFAALAAFFVWLSVKNMTRQDWIKLEDSLHRANYWLLVPVLGLLLASHWLRALRWRQLIVSMGYKTSILNCFLAVMIGYFANIGARLGEVLKCTIIARYDKVPADKLVGTVVAERAFDLICLLSVFALTLIFQYDVIHSLTADKINSLFHNAQGQISWLKITLLLAIAAIVLLAGRWALKSFGHTTIVRKIKNIFVNIWHGLTSVRGVKNKPLFFVYTVGIWGLYLLSTWFGFFAISATSHLTIIDALSVLAMGSIGMIISPGGIGAYALLVAQTVAFYGIPEAPYGQALGWLLWFGQFLSFILFGTISFILLPRINKSPLVIEPIKSESIALHEITRDPNDPA
ncbi:MAG TPA: lysylphosphatidylglycerol synthase transmembrane domain-containing protein [Puia sp.]|nr:lysylphosphatidylglycerol synthase transmembrane domain-containing protein [Puia sp.]